MTQIFSVFDPSSLFNLKMNWISSFLILIFPPSSYWIIYSKNMKFKILLMKFFNKEFYTIMGNFMSPGSSWILISLLFFIMMNNMLGLMPYIFTSSTHISMSLSLSLPMWLGCFLMSIYMNLSLTLAHLVPRNTPYLMINFLVIIEMISNFIRPFTLSLRLSANMAAGHLLLIILSEFTNKNHFMLLIMSLMVMSILMILELGVSIIQSYVFSSLMLLYIKDMNFSNLYM